MPNDFQLHEETIATWIKSCNSELQLPICEEAIKNLLIEKFKEQVNVFDLQLAVDGLRKLIIEKERQIRYYSDQPNTNGKLSNAYY